MTTQNLDRLCAQYGYQIADEVQKEIGKGAENHITKSLGVLQENGVYAFFLYQASRSSERDGAEKLSEQACALLNDADLKPFDTVRDPLTAVRGNKKMSGLADNLDDLLLAKRLLEQALIYARYHAKAAGDGQ